MKTSKTFKLRSQGLPFKEMGSSPLNEGFGVLQADANKEQAFDARLNLDKQVESNVASSKESVEGDSGSWWSSMKNKAKEAYDNIDVKGTLDNVQTGLTAAGMVPGVGNAVDFVNAGISTARAGHAKLTGDDESAKKYAKEAGENLLYAAPGVGTVAAGAKLTKKSIAAAKTLKGSDKVQDAKNVVNKAKQTKQTIKKTGDVVDATSGGTQLASNDKKKDNKPKDNKPKENKKPAPKKEAPKIAKVKTPKKKDKGGGNDKA